MSTLRRRLLARARGEDAGIAIVAAMGVVMLVAILLVVLVSVALSEAGQSGRDRQRSSSVASAEGAVDLVTAQIQSATPTVLSSICGGPGTGTVAGDQFTFQTTVTYYAAGTAVACPAVQSTPVDEAKIVVTATANKISGTSVARRTVESLVKLTPSYNIGLDKAIFSNSTLTLANNATLISGSGKPDADIYTNTDFTCNNNEEFFGSIYAQGSITMSNTCTVHVDTWAGGMIKFDNPGVSVAGQVLSHNGTITLGHASVGQQARGPLTVTGDVCSTAGKCFPGVPVDAPPSEAFPPFTWDATAQAAWAAAGYTNVVQLPNASYPCGGWSQPGSLNGKGDGAGIWMHDNASTLPANTILIVNCPTSKVTLQGVDVTLNKNLLILSRLGFDFTNKETISSVPGTGTAANPNLLYLIQPAAITGQTGWTTYTCQGDGIALDNQVTVENTVNTLLYSPCSIRKANKTAIVGQVYSGAQTSIDNQFNMTYIPMPVWGGLPTAGGQIKSYSVQTLYKRETK